MDLEKNYALGIQYGKGIGTFFNEKNFFNISLKAKGILFVFDVSKSSLSLLNMSLQLFFYIQ